MVNNDDERINRERQSAAEKIIEEREVKNQEIEGREAKSSWDFSYNYPKASGGMGLYYRCNRLL